MRFLAAVEIASISMFHKKRRRFSLEITMGEKSVKAKQIICYCLYFSCHKVAADIWIHLSWKLQVISSNLNLYQQPIKTSNLAWVNFGSVSFPPHLHKHNGSAPPKLYCTLHAYSTTPPLLPLINLHNEQTLTHLQHYGITNLAYRYK